MSAADAGLSGFQAVIAGDIMAREDHHERVLDVERVAEPDERPDPRAQWDEVKGEWVVWDETDEAWEEIEDAASEDE